MKFNLSTFHHIKNNIRVEDEGKLHSSKGINSTILYFYKLYVYKQYFSETVRERNNPNAKLKTLSVETKEILAELERDYKPAKSEKDETSTRKADKFNAVRIFIRSLPEC